MTDLGHHGAMPFEFILSHGPEAVAINASPHPQDAFLAECWHTKQLHGEG